MHVEGNRVPGSSSGGKTRLWRLRLERTKDNCQLLVMMVEDMGQAGWDLDSQVLRAGSSPSCWCVVVTSLQDGASGRDGPQVPVLKRATRTLTPSCLPLFLRWPPSYQAQQLPCCFSRLYVHNTSIQFPWFFMLQIIPQWSTCTCQSVYSMLVFKVTLGKGLSVQIHTQLV